MPSWLLAAQIQQVSEGIAPQAHIDKEIVAATGLAEAEDEVELALDFQGHKHVDTSEDTNETYTLQNDTFSSHTKFTMPGQATASALRDYLSKHLQPHQIVNDYGNECDLFSISNDHLTVLQAKLWSRASKGRLQIKTISSHPSKAQITMCNHVAKISQALEEKHIFILSDARHDICQYTNDRDDRNSACHTKVIRIEPLVHWGTVIPATPSQWLLTFRRDGCLMQNPAYKQLVKDLTDVETPTYCFYHLRYLWNKRTEAGDITRQLAGVVSHEQFVDVARIAQNGTHRPLWDSSFASFNAIAPAIGSAAYGDEPGMVEKQRDIEVASFQLDGASDYTNINQTHNHHRDNSQICSTIRKGLSIDEDSDGHCGRTSSSSYSSAFVHSLHTTSFTSEGSDGSSSPTTPQPSLRVPNLTATQTNDTMKEDLHTKDAIIRNKYGFRVKIQTTLPRAMKRRFGRELANNSTITPTQARKSPWKITKEASLFQESLLPIPLQPIKPMKPLKKAKDLAKATEKRNNAAEYHQTRKQNEAQITKTKECILAHYKLQVNSTAGRQSTPEPQCPILLPSPPKLVTHFAKRLPNTDVPQEIATLAFEAFENIYPTPTSKICMCNKPASYGKFKKGEVPQIAQCMNQECRFRWYHYTCLDQSDKGKARWGTLICQYCRNEDALAKQNKINSQTLTQQIDLRPRWTRKDIEVEMPGLGGHVPVGNPYGLGIEIELHPEYSEAKVQIKGMPGDLL